MELIAPSTDGKANERGVVIEWDRVREDWGECVVMTLGAGGRTALVLITGLGLIHNTMGTVHSTLFPLLRHVYGG